MLEFSRFTFENTPLYQDYLALKRKIFAFEFGWNIPLMDGHPSLALADPYDEISVFIGCFSGSEIVGAARVSGPTDPKPYSELYEDYLDKGILNRNYVVINGVAVVSELRGRKVVSSIEGAVGQVTVGHRIMEEVESLASELGADHQLLTAGHGRSEKFFHHIGFGNLGPKYNVDWAPVPLVDCAKPVNLTNRCR